MTQLKIAILQSSYEGSRASFRDLDPACDPARSLSRLSTYGSFFLAGGDCIMSWGIPS